MYITFPNFGSVCPHCGHCPNCGRRGIASSSQPYSSAQPCIPAQPYWGGNPLGTAVGGQIQTITGLQAWN